MIVNYNHNMFIVHATETKKNINNKNQVYLIKKSYLPVIIPFLLSLFPISYSKRQTPNTPLVYGDML